MKPFLFIFMSLNIISNAWAQDYISTKYKNGQIKEVGFREANQKKEGHWKFYYENGQIEAEGDYKNGIKVDEWKFYYKNGQLSSIGSYTSNGTKYGDWKYYYENGNPKSENLYDNGQLKAIGKYSSRQDGSSNIYKIGKWEYFYKDGSTKGIVYYKKIKNRGSSTIDRFNENTIFYYPNGQVKMKGEKDEMNNITWTHYYPNGQIKHIYNSTSNKNYKDYQFITFYESGIVYEQTKMNSDDNRILNYAAYYPSNKPMITGQLLIHDYGISANGTWIYYNELGDIDKEINLQGGWILDKKGKRTNNTFRGLFKVNSYYVDDSEPNQFFYTSWHKPLFSGIASWVNLILKQRTDFFESGKIRVIYKEDNKGEYNIPISAFNTNGEQTLKNGSGYVLNYSQNISITGSKDYFLESKINYENGFRVGKAIWYYPNGNIRTSVIYKKDELKPSQGLLWEIVESFDPEGTSINKGTLKNGTGTWTYYSSRDFDYGWKYVYTKTFKNGEEMK